MNLHLGRLAFLSLLFACLLLLAGSRQAPGSPAPQARAQRPTPPWRLLASYRGPVHEQHRGYFPGIDFGGTPTRASWIIYLHFTTYPGDDLTKETRPDPAHPPSPVQWTFYDHGVPVYQTGQGREIITYRVRNTITKRFRVVDQDGETLFECGGYRRPEGDRDWRRALVFPWSATPRGTKKLFLVDELGFQAPVQVGAWARPLNSTAQAERVQLAPPPKAPPANPPDPTAEATRLLNQARTLLSRSRELRSEGRFVQAGSLLDAARSRLEKIGKRYAVTPVAAEARQLLKELPRW